MKTQIENIKEAKKAYILELSESRFAVYLLINDELVSLWPSDSHNGKKSKELLPYQIYSKNRNYPAFHFYINGGGFSKTYEINAELNKINQDIEVFVLRGCNPAMA